MISFEVSGTASKHTTQLEFKLDVSIFYPFFSAKSYLGRLMESGSLKSSKKDLAINNSFNFAAFFLVVVQKKREQREERGKGDSFRDLVSEQNCFNFFVNYAFEAASSFGAYQGHFNSRLKDDDYI